MLGRGGLRYAGGSAAESGLALGEDLASFLDVWGRFCAVLRQGDGEFFLMGEETGSSFSGAVTPGHYRFRIHYQANLGDSALIRMFPKNIAVKPEQVWPGRAVSNWIDVTIKKE